MYLKKKRYSYVVLICNCVKNLKAKNRKKKSYI